MLPEVQSTLPSVLELLQFNLSLNIFQNSQIKRLLYRVSRSVKNWRGSVETESQSDRIKLTASSSSFLGS